MLTTNGFFVDRGARGAQGPRSVTHGLNRDRRHTFALCHYNKKEPPQTDAKLKYTHAASMYASLHTSNYAKTPHKHELHYTPKWDVQLKPGALQKAKAKCQGRGVLLTKLQA